MRISPLILAILYLAISPAQASLRERCSWPGSPSRPEFADVLMTPLVLDLDGDGRSEMVLAAAESRTGTALLEVVDSQCNTLMEIGDPGCVRCVGDIACRDLNNGSGAVLRPVGLAAGDLDGDGSPEIVGVVASPAGDTRLIAFNADGSFRWCSSPSPTLGFVGPLSSGVPAIVNTDGVGPPEIVVGSAVFGADGTFLSYGSDFLLWPVPSVVADVDGLAGSELLIGPAALRSDGSVLWDLRGGSASFGIARSAAVDLGRDGTTEVLLGGRTPNALYVLDGSSGATIDAVSSHPTWDPAHCT